MSNASGSYDRADRRLGRHCRIHHLRSLHHQCRQPTATVRRFETHVQAFQTSEFRFGTHRQQLCARCATLRTVNILTCGVSAGALCPTLPEGDVRGVGLTGMTPLPAGAPGKFLMALEFICTVPALTSPKYPKRVRYTARKRCAGGNGMFAQCCYRERRNVFFLEENDVVTKSKSPSNPGSVSPDLRHRMVWRSPVSGLRDDLFIHVDLFVFPPLTEHNKGGGWNFKESPLYGNGLPFSLHRSAFHNVCVVLITPSA